MLTSHLRNSSNWTSHFKDGRLLLDESPATAVTPENWAFATTAEECEPMQLWRKELRRLLQHPDGCSEDIYSTFRLVNAATLTSI